MPNKPRGTVRGRKTTPKQQRLFGAARSVQETGKKSFPEADKLAKSISPSDLHNMAQKPKGGYRSLKKSGRMAKFEAKQLGQP